MLKVFESFLILSARNYAITSRSTCWDHFDRTVNSGHVYIGEKDSSHNYYLIQIKLFTQHSVFLCWKPGFLDNQRYIHPEKIF